MGQQVVALMYGLQRSKNKDFFNENGAPFWNDYKGPKEKRLPHESEFSPRVTCEGGDVFGFPVAAGPSCNETEAFLGVTVRVEDVGEVFKQEIAVAKENWSKFSTWVRDVHGKVLPKPRLLLTTDER